MEGEFQRYTTFCCDGVLKDGLITFGKRPDSEFRFTSFLSVGTGLGLPSCSGCRSRLGGREGAGRGGGQGWWRRKLQLPLRFAACLDALLAPFGAAG